MMLPFDIGAPRADVEARAALATPAELDALEAFFSAPKLLRYYRVTLEVVRLERDRRNSSSASEAAPP